MVRWGTAVVAVLAIMGSVGAPAQASGGRPRTNIAVLDSVASMAAADLLRGATIPQGRAVRVLTPLPGDTLGLFAQGLVEQLRAGGAEVKLPQVAVISPVSAPDAPDAPPLNGGTMDLEIRVQVTGAGVTWVRAIKKFPMGVSGYERFATMRAVATLVDLGTGDVLWTRVASAEATDRVSKGQIALVQAASVGLNPPLPSGSKGRLIEPLIVVGIVTGLVVLFYSNRN